MRKMFGHKEAAKPKEKPKTKKKASKPSVSKVAEEKAVVVPPEEEDYIPPNDNKYCLRVNQDFPERVIVTKSWEGFGSVMVKKKAVRGESVREKAKKKGTFVQEKTDGDVNTAISVFAEERPAKAAKVGEVTVNEDGEDVNVEIFQYDKEYVLVDSRLCPPETIWVYPFVPSDDKGSKFPNRWVTDHPQKEQFHWVAGTYRVDSKASIKKIKEAIGK